MNDSDRMVTVLEFDDSHEITAARDHKRRMEGMQADSARSATGQTRAFESSHERLAKLAERTAERHRTMFDAIDRMAERTSRGIGAIADMSARVVVKTAEVVGAVGLLGVTLRGFFNHLRDGEVDVGRHTVAVDKLVNLYRVARLALAPTLLTAGTLGVGILAEYAFAQTAAKARQVQADSLIAARTGRSFQTVSTIGMAGVLSGEGRGQFQSVFGGRSPARVQNLIDEYRALKDPVDQAAFAVKNFGENAERAMPLLRDRLKENIDRAYELSTALDSKTRQSLRAMSDEMRQPIEDLKTFSSWLRNVREEAKQGIVLGTVAVHDVLHETQGFADIRAARAAAGRGMAPGAFPEAPPPLPSDLQFAAGALEAAQERQAQLQARGTVFPLSQDIVRRSSDAISRFRGDATLAGLQRRRGEQETSLEASMRRLDLTAEHGGVKGTALEQTTREAVLQASNELFTLKGQIKAAERTVQEGEAGFRKVEASIAHQLEAQKQATAKLFEGAIVNSRAGQFDPSLPSFASEALQSFENASAARGILPYMYLPRRKSEERQAGQLVSEEAQRRENKKQDDEQHLNALERQGRLEERLLTIQGTDARRVIEDTYTLRLNSVTQVYELEKQIIGETLAGYRAAETRDEARVQRTEEIARLEREHFDTIKREASGLFETLFTHPGQFGGQLLGTVKAAALKPITEGLGNLTAKLLYPVIYGNQPEVKLSSAGDHLHNAASALIDAAQVMRGGWTGGYGGGAAGGGGAYDGGFSPVGGSPLGMAGILGPGGTSGFAGSPGGFGGMFSGGGTRGGGIAGLFSGGGFGGILKNIKGMNWGGLTRTPSRWSMDEDGNLTQIHGSRITGVHGLAGAALMAGGTYLAQSGLLGSARGTGEGIAMGTLGGAAIGFTMGGPLGAGIGAAVGFGIGLGEKIAGVESAAHQAHRLIMSIYRVDIPEGSGIMQQILQIAQQYGSVSGAVRTAQARQLIEMYGLALGRSGPMAFLDSPRGASLVQQGSTLSQGLSYFNGLGYNFQSSLPTLGSSSGVIPTSSPYSNSGSPTMLQISLNGQSAADAMSGQITRVTTPEYVAGQNVAALRSGGSRFATLGAVIAPSTIFA